MQRAIYLSVKPDNQQAALLKNQDAFINIASFLSTNDQANLLSTSQLSQHLFSRSNVLSLQRIEKEFLADNALLQKLEQRLVTRKFIAEATMALEAKQCWDNPVFMDRDLSSKQNTLFFLFLMAICISGLIYSCIGAAEGELLWLIPVGIDLALMCCVFFTRNQGQSKPDTYGWLLNEENGFLKDLPAQLKKNRHIRLPLSWYPRFVLEAAQSDQKSFPLESPPRDLTDEPMGVVLSSAIGKEKYLSSQIQDQKKVIATRFKLFQLESKSPVKADDVKLEGSQP